MRYAIAGLALGTLIIASPARADDWSGFFDSIGSRSRGYSPQHQSFNRIATFSNYLNQQDPADDTVSEIVAATADGKTLVYTDAASGAIGFIDITDPVRPKADGLVSFDGDPTSVDVLGNRYALVGVNTSEDFIDVSGVLAVVDIEGRDVVRTIELGGQPDSLKISPDERYVAIVIENERDEEICVGGGNDGMEAPEDDDDAAAACVAGGGQVGVIPQNGPGTSIGNPPGTLAIVDIGGWGARFVDLTGLDGCFGPTDPEPEFVDVNDDNLAVVSLQENNCLAVVDLQSGKVKESFSALAVSLSDIDAADDGVIVLDDALDDVAREPDAVAWIDRRHGYDRIATANEGDLFGGSRGFSIFSQNGEVVFDIGNEYEQLAVRVGHYPEGRSDAKGTEPEAVEFGTYRFGDYLFVGSERASFIGVYKLDWADRPELVQMLPGPLGPEGLLAIPSRNLLVASGEDDDPTFGVRSTVMIYRLEWGEADYPQLISDDDGGKPIP
jgi:hypothetical protein